MTALFVVSLLVGAPLAETALPPPLSRSSKLDPYEILPPPVFFPSLQSVVSRLQPMAATAVPSFRAFRDFRSLPAPVFD